MTTTSPRHEPTRHEPQAPPSTALANADLAPTTAESATWRSWDIFCLWMTSAHSLGSYGFAVGILAMGLTGWQAIVGLFLGVLILWGGSNLVGVAGQAVGVPFPVFARASFGIFGANIPALLRGLVAIFWYGIQTYLASQAVIVLLLRISPSLADLNDGDGFLGLPLLGWISFAVLWVVQLLVLGYGMDVVRRASDFAGPVVWIGMIALAVWLLEKADWSVDFGSRQPGIAAVDAPVATIIGVAFLMVAFMAGPLINYADFARLAPSAKAVRRGNALGIPLNETAFIVLSVVIALCSIEVYGDLQDPVALMSHVENDAVVALSALLFAIATVGINVVLNFVSPSYDISNVAPKYISFRTGGIITAILSVVVLPWKVWESANFVHYFLGGVGALMGPIFGILVVHYYLLRRGKIDVAQLYSVAPEGNYYFTRGFNPAALTALIVAGAAGIWVTFGFDDPAITSWAWPLSAILGAALMLGLSGWRGGRAGKTHPA